MGPPGSLEVGGHGFRIQGVRPRLAGLGIGGYWRATVESRLNEWFRVPPGVLSPPASAGVMEWKIHE